jgi:alpha-glucosidase (family GH31 glycosyl hydrolase)
MGIEIMVSVWPFTCPNSRSYDTIVDNQWLTTYLNQSGSRSSRPVETHGKSCYLVDVTNPEFRKYLSFRFQCFLFR